MEEKETRTGKVTPIGMDTILLVPVRRVTPLLPDGLKPLTFLGKGMIGVGAWHHSETFIDEAVFGPAIEVYVAPLAWHRGRRISAPHTIYNSNPRYAAAVCETFKFNKIPAEIEWRVAGDRHEVVVSKDGRPALRLEARPTFLPFPFALPFTRPRFCYVVREGRRYLVSIHMAVGRTRFARMTVDIAPEGPLAPVAEAARGARRISFIYQDSKLDVPLPEAL